MSNKVLNLAASALLSPDTAFDEPVYRNERTLLEVAVCNARLWAAAEAKFRQPSDSTGFRTTHLQFGPGLSSIPFQGLPSEVHLLLPAGADLRTLCQLSATCAFFRKECMLVLSARMERAFEMFDLNWLAFRFMLTQCNAITSGWFIYHLVRMEFSKFARFTTIDVYVRKGLDAELVCDFLNVATSYREAEREVDSRVYENYGVLDTLFFDHSSLPFTIAVHRCWEEPRITVMRGPITCLFSWMCGKGVFMAYPDLTLDGRTMVSHAHVPLRSPSHKQHLLALDATAAMHGVSLTTFHDGRTTFPTRESCALSRTCPAEPRNSFDSSSFQMIFHDCGWHRGVDRQSLNVDVYWVLGAMDCCVEKTGIVFSADELSRQQRKNGDDVVYMTRLESAILWK
ncbi:hypothetical protein B0H12DRAFT_1234816 [Mycena haematopus]|nr:hypothetical protein B0H12DRAFT_1246092 [Mycena haematopus]KAJ7249155.1 hypothetical protein B0H12DRAFT_1234816 [Mycena haematopus]